MYRKFFQTVLEPACYAMILLTFGCAAKPPLEDTRLRSQVVAVALSMQGKPYRYGGSTPAGFDCSGLVQYSFKKSGLNIPRNSYAQYKFSAPVYISRMQPGDLVFFRIDGSFVSHVGIYIGDGRFVHAPGKNRSVSIDQLDADYWQKRLVGGGSVFRKL